MNLKTLKKILLLTSLAVTLSIIFLSLWLFKLDSEIRERSKSNWFVPPTEIYSAPEPILIGQKLKLENIVQQLKTQNYRERNTSQQLFAHDYSLFEGDECKDLRDDLSFEDVGQCLLFKTPAKNFGPQRKALTKLIILDTENIVMGLYVGRPGVPQDRITLEPQLFAQFYGEKPIMRRVLELSQIPLECSLAITAIEDRNFLEHSGFSFKGYARALWGLITKQRIIGGGSTITQQLVKNYFLTSEKTFKRKFIEFFMAIILENRMTKDQILTNYLNVIYMGQNGPFQVRGYGSAAKHYFSKRIEDLNLSECALLAAIVNSPGRFNPFRKPENAIKRRAKVIQHMLDLKMVDEEEALKVKDAPLPTRPPKVLSEPAPYFVQAIRKELARLDIEGDSGLRVFTTLSEQAQEAAQQSIKKGLQHLESYYKSLKEIKEGGNHLEATLISVDLHSGGILALVGGRSFRKTQYNRALDSHRQVGSIMKPFVYLAALESLTPDGNAYTPLTPLMDEPFEHKYDGQVWAPQNYEKKFIGSVPLFYALKNSMNVPTAKLGLDVGLTGVIDVAKRMGIESEIQPLPSLSLGAYELFPWEVVRGYSTLARMGSRTDIHYIQAIEDLKGNNIYQTEAESEQVIAEENAAVLIGMMKQTIKTGTGRSIPLRGFTHPTAGKTGTTSDTKDAWFAGFTPYVLTVVWLGYDNNLSHGMTGSSGAIPLWTTFMKSYASKYPQHDFPWPESVTKYTLPAEELESMMSELKDHEKNDVELIFRSGNEP